MRFGKKSNQSMSHFVKKMKTFNAVLPCKWFILIKLLLSDPFMARYVYHTKTSLLKQYNTTIQMSQMRHLQRIVYILFAFNEKGKNASRAYSLHSCNVTLTDTCTV